MNGAPKVPRVSFRSAAFGNSSGGGGGGGGALFNGAADEQPLPAAANPTTSGPAGAAWRASERMRRAFDQAERIRRAPDLTHYEILQISRTATTSEISKSWKRLMLTLAPDKIRLSGLSKEEATAIAQRLNDAHGTLSNPAQRHAYDQQLRARDDDCPNEHDAKEAANALRLSTGAVPSDWLRTLAEALRAEYGRRKSAKKADGDENAGLSADEILKCVVSPAVLESLDGAARAGLGLPAQERGKPDLLPTVAAQPMMCPDCGRGFQSQAECEAHDREVHSDVFCARVAQIGRAMAAAGHGTLAELLSSDELDATVFENSNNDPTREGRGRTSDESPQVVVPPRVWSRAPARAAATLPSAELLHQVAYATPLQWSQLFRTKTFRTKVGSANKAWLREVKMGFTSVSNFQTHAQRAEAEGSRLFERTWIAAIEEFRAGESLPIAEAGQAPQPDVPNGTMISVVQPPKAKNSGADGGGGNADSSVAQGRTEQNPEWQEATSCMVCDRTLTWLLIPTAKRHHCRGCGQVLCDACASTFVPLPRLGLSTQRHRVCAHCASNDTREWAVQAWRAIILNPEHAPERRALAAKVLYSGYKCTDHAFWDSVAQQLEEVAPLTVSLLVNQWTHNRATASQLMARAAAMLQKGRLCDCATLTGVALHELPRPGSAAEALAAVKGLVLRSELAGTIAIQLAMIAVLGAASTPDGAIWGPATPSVDDALAAFATWYRAQDVWEHWLVPVAMHYLRDPLPSRASAVASKSSWVSRLVGAGDSELAAWCLLHVGETRLAPWLDVVASVLPARSSTPATDRPAHPRAAQFVRMCLAKAGRLHRQATGEGATQWLKEAEKIIAARSAPSGTAFPGATVLLLCALEAARALSPGNQGAAQVGSGSTVREDVISALRSVELDVTDNAWACAGVLLLCGVPRRGSTRKVGVKSQTVALAMEAFGVATQKLRPSKQAAARTFLVGSGFWKSLAHTALQRRECQRAVVLAGTALRFLPANTSCDDKVAVAVQLADGLMGVGLGTRAVEVLVLAVRAVFPDGFASNDVPANGSLRRQRWQVLSRLAKVMDAVGEAADIVLGAYRAASAQQDIASFQQRIGALQNLVTAAEAERVAKAAAPLHLCRFYDKPFTAAVLSAFRRRDEFALKSFLDVFTRTSTSSDPPRNVRAIRALAEGALDMLRGDAFRGARHLLEAVVLNPAPGTTSAASNGSDNDEEDEDHERCYARVCQQQGYYVAAAAAILADPQSRVAGVLQLRAVLHRASRTGGEAGIKKLLRTQWLAEALNAAPGFATDAIWGQQLRPLRRFEAAAAQVAKSAEAAAENDSTFDSAQDSLVEAPGEKLRNAALLSVDTTAVCGSHLGYVRALVEAGRLLVKSAECFARAAHRKRGQKRLQEQQERYVSLGLAQACLLNAATLARDLPTVDRAHMLACVAALQIHALLKSETWARDKVLVDLAAANFRAVVRLARLVPAANLAPERCYDAVLGNFQRRKLAQAHLEFLGAGRAGLLSHVGVLATEAECAYTYFEGVWTGWVTREKCADDEDSDGEFEDMEAGEAALAAMSGGTRREAATVEDVVSEADAQRRRALRKRKWEDDRNQRRAARCVRRVARDTQFQEKARFRVLGHMLRQGTIRGDPWAEPSRLVRCFGCPRTPDGFLDRRRSVLKSHYRKATWWSSTAPTSHNQRAASFAHFDGYNITGSGIQFRLRKPRSGELPLFNWDDVADAVAGCIEHPVLSLDAVDPEGAPLHPMQLITFLPATLRGTSILATLFHADYLLKAFTCGAEVSASPPFPLRPTTAPGGLLEGLPQHLVEVLTLCVREGASSSGRAISHRFWVEALELPFDSSDDLSRADLGSLRMCVRKHRLVVNPATGEMIDAPGEGDEDNSPEARFAQAFTQHYDEIAKHFPVFARLRELAKVCAAVRLLSAKRKDGQETLRRVRQDTDRASVAVRQWLNEALNDPPAGFPFSQNEQKISELLEQSIRDQNVPYHQRSEARRLWRPQLCEQMRAQEEQIVCQLAKQLSSQFPSINASSLHDAVRTWACGYGISGLVSALAPGLIASQVAQLKQSLAALSFLGSEQLPQPAGTRLSGPISQASRGWVPSAFYRLPPASGDADDRSIRRVFGGVNLGARLQSARVQPPPTSQYHRSTVALGAQRAQGVPNSAAQRIDNMHRHNMQTFWNQQRANNANAAARGGGGGGGGGGSGGGSGGFFGGSAYFHHGFFTGTRAAYRNGEYVGYPNQPLRVDADRINTFTGGNVNEVNIRHHNRLPVTRFYDTCGRAGVGGAYWTSGNFSSRAAARQGLAIKPEWSGMNARADGYLSGVRALSGIAASQGVGLSGGAQQFYLPRNTAALNQATRTAHVRTGDNIFED